MTGRQFYDEANRRLLRPLKLTETIPQDGPRLKGVVQGYAGANNPFGGSDAMIVNGKFVINPQFEWTGGGYASTAIDLVRWAKMIYEGKAFPPELLPQVLDGNITTDVRVAGEIDFAHTTRANLRADLITTELGA